MRLIENAILREVRGKWLLLIFNDRGTKAMEVNESFSFLWNRFSQKDFQVEDLAGALIEEYKLTPDAAMKDAGDTIDLWRSKHLIKE